MAEVRFDHSEVVHRLVLLRVTGALEEPDIHHSHPGPLGLGTAICLNCIVGLLLFRHPPKHGIGRMVGRDGVPVHLGHPDGLVLIPVLDHDVPNVLRTGEIQHPGPHPPVGGA